MIEMNFEGFYYKYAGQMNYSKNAKKLYPENALEVF